MTRESEVAEQNSAIQAIACGLMALVDELHEAGVVDREAVAGRLSRLRREGGQPIEMIEALAKNLAKGNFASRSTRDVMSVIDGGKVE